MKLYRGFLNRPTISSNAVLSPDWKRLMSSSSVGFTTSDILILPNQTGNIGSQHRYFEIVRPHAALDVHVGFFDTQYAVIDVVHGCFNSVIGVFFKHV